MITEKGEEIAMAGISGSIPGTGRYTFLAKKRRDNKYEWVHFKERDHGRKEGVYLGEAKVEKELKMVFELMNKNLVRIFGPHAEMKEGIPGFRSIPGTRFDDTVNQHFVYD